MAVVNNKERTTKKNHCTVENNLKSITETILETKTTNVRSRIYTELKQQCASFRRYPDEHVFWQFRVVVRELQNNRATVPPAV